MQGTLDDRPSKPHLRGCIPRLRSLRAVLAADLHRYAGRTGAQAFAKHYLFTPGYKYTVIMRTCGYLKTKPFMTFCLFPIAK